MNEGWVFLMLPIVIVASVLGGVIYYEHLWITQTSDYHKCISSCESMLDERGSDPDIEFACLEMCLPLSGNYCIGRG